MKSLTIAQIIDKLENANIQVSEYKEDKKLCGYELNTYTDCGVNQIVFIDFRGKKMNPKSGKEFLELYNERINDIDINEEMKMHSEDKRYMQEIGYEVGIQDFKDWKENLQNIFVKNKKTAEQRQFEQTADKLQSLVNEMQETLNLMPIKGSSTGDCQRTNINHFVGILDSCIAGISLEDFTPNEYSRDFKLSYS
jgi:hypothetical protein